MISDIDYDKPWGASSNAAGNISNESHHGEGKSDSIHLMIYSVSTIP
ncbi:MAG TPA: hypothetical protein VFR94_09130 [Nitrososphaeraceae archaeon]|nr:hypothetical protein [Nitrososphaeraceae archaeon]